MPERDAPGRRPPDDPTGDPPWVHGHAHEPNLKIPASDGDFVVVTPSGRVRTVSPAELARLPYTSVPDCLIVSTGHGASGPFTFGGVRLIDLLAYVLWESPAAPVPLPAPIAQDSADENRIDLSEQGAVPVADRSGYRGEDRGEDRSEGQTDVPGALQTATVGRGETGGLSSADEVRQTSHWHYADLVSADGFGTRLTPADLADAGDRPVLLAYMLDGAPLTREQGRVRLIVPSERDDALRQVKWLATITIV